GAAGDDLTAGIGDALRYHGHHITKAVVDALHIVEETVDFEVALRKVDEVRRVRVLALAEGRASREPARVASHDLDDLDRVEAAHGLSIQAGLEGGNGQVSGHAPIAGTVIGERQVVVDGLGQ